MRKLPNATRNIKPAPGAVHTNAMVPPVDDFRDRAFLLEHVADTLAFYAPAGHGPSGGFFHYFKDDGPVYDAALHAESASAAAMSFGT